ncbi:MAG: hypothetical protein AAF790_02440 [Planctomycetota bacterium]
MAEPVLAGPGLPEQGLQEPTWLPAGLLGAALMLAMSLSAAGAEPAVGTQAETQPSRWRAAKPSPATTGAAAAGSVAKAKRTHEARQQTQRASRAQTRAGRSATPGWRAAGSADARRRQKQRDARVRPVGYEDDGYEDDAYGAKAYGAKAYGNEAYGRARTRSVVVNGAGARSGYQVAQAEQDDFGAELERALAEPFGAEELPQQQPGQQQPLPPESLPGMMEPGEPLGGRPDPFDESALPEIDSTLPEIDSAPPSLPADPGGAAELPPIDAQDGPPGLGPADPLTPLPEPIDSDPLGGDLLDDGLPPGDPMEADADDRAERYNKQRSAVAKDCAEELAELKASRLNMIDIRVRVPGEEGKDYPFVCSIDDGTPFAPRAWAEVTYMWKASGLCHKPLYFEQTHLERYGHSWGPYLDPVVSGAHFFTRFPVLPYCMGLKAPTECVYTLGHYRPGSCAPYMIEPPGFTPRAALLEIGAWTGAFFVVP